MEARIAFLPCFDLRILVGGVVVADDVNLLVRRDVVGNMLQEIEPLLMSVAVHALADDPTGGNIHGGKEQFYAVALLVTSNSLTSALLERKTRLSPVKCLDLTLFVTGQYDRILRRREVKANNIIQLLLKVLIIGKLKALDSMRLESVCRP